MIDEIERRAERAGRAWCVCNDEERALRYLRPAIVFWPFLACGPATALAVAYARHEVLTLDLADRGYRADAS